MRWQIFCRFLLTGCLTVKNKEAPTARLGLERVEKAILAAKPQSPLLGERVAKIFDF